MRLCEAILSWAGARVTLDGRGCMEYRDLGRSGLRVSEIGFGAWAIGGDAWGPVEDAESLAAMERAVELGINFIDMADARGQHTLRRAGYRLPGRDRDRLHRRSAWHEPAGEA